jgi:hypothetical protein
VEGPQPGAVMVYNATTGASLGAAATTGEDGLVNAWGLAINPE